MHNLYALGWQADWCFSDFQHTFIYCAYTAKINRLTTTALSCPWIISCHLQYPVLSLEKQAIFKHKTLAHLALIISYIHCLSQYVCLLHALSQ